MHCVCVYACVSSVRVRVPIGACPHGLRNHASCVYASGAFGFGFSLWVHSLGTLALTRVAHKLARARVLARARARDVQPCVKHTATHTRCVRPFISATR